MHPLAVAIDELHAGAHGDAHPVAVVHTDLPANDFSSLFTTVEHDPDTYRRPGVYTYAAGRSFYEQLLPDASVHLGWSATATLWLRRVPGPLPGHLFSYAAAGAARSRWNDAATHDWTTFLQRRARELAPGGQLVVSVPISGSGYLEWMHVVEAGARDARDTGVLDASEYERLVIPTYLSEPTDLAGAVEATTGLTLEESESAVAPDPAYDAFRTHRDAARYATDAVGLLRAWAEPSVRSALDGRRGEAQRSTAADAFFGAVQARLAAAPTECRWTIGLMRIGAR
jgi:hypothetical protein